MDGAARSDGVAERIAALVMLVAILFIALAMTGTLPLSGPHGAGATQYCTQYQYNPGCDPLVPPLIAFSSTRDGGGNTEIYVMNADGSGQTRIFSNTNAFEGQPSWRPDGEKLAFASLRDGNLEIYTMNVDGSGVVRLTANTATDVNPAWSPDGTRIAFESLRDGNQELYVMNADGTGQARLTVNAAADSQPAWSPDGSKLAFASTRSGSSQIWLVNPDGSNPARLTFDGATDTAPAWSPDGKRIAFTSGVGAAPSHVWVVNADGSGLVQLTNAATSDSSPTWSPDGTKIAFSRVSGNNLNVMVMDADGSGVTHLTNDFAVDATPKWQPGPPGAPTGVSATAGAGKATVTFTPPVQLGGAAIVRYTATASPGGAQGFSTGGPIVVHGLTNGQTYTFIVNASNLAGSGPPSAPSNPVTPQPLDLTATLLTASNAVYVPGTWTNMSVTVTFFCTDVGGPGVASFSAPVVVAVDGIHNVPGSCTDNDGKTVTQAFGPIWVDLMAPTLTATLTNADGTPYTPGTWTGQTVTVSFTCVDAVSGVASFSAPMTVTTSGAGQSRTGLCTDVAGNVGSLTVANIMVDRTAPTITATFRNADGGLYVPAPLSWTNQNVTVTFACTDPGGSGVASFSAPVTVSSEGFNQSVTGLCTDLAGNVASRSFANINIDKTPPSTPLTTLTTSDGIPYTPGQWTRLNVTVTFFCLGVTGSPIISPPPIVVSSEGVNQQVTGTCTDFAQNSTSLVVGGIQIDKTPPVVTASFTNADGSTYTLGQWTNQAVLITPHCADALSGAGDVSLPELIPTDVDGVSRSFFCRDNAGNFTTQAFGPFRVDLTPPAISASFKNADGSPYVPFTWTNQTVTVTFDCSDAGSGVASVSSPVIVSDAGTHFASGFCIDVAGNVSQPSVGPINIDRVPPQLTATFHTTDGAPYALGSWTRQPVDVIFFCTDGNSNVASVSAPVTVSTFGAGQTVTGMCTDNAGNVTSQTFSPINIDNTAPVLSATFANADGSPYVPGTWTRQSVVVTFACTDTGTSGVASYSGPITVSAEGADQTVSGTCTDNVGIVTTRTFGPIDIDKTPPEAVILFHPAFMTLIVSAETDGSSVMGTSDALVTDLAGNTLLVRFTVDHHPNDEHDHIVSLSYNGGAPVAAPPNTLDYSWELKLGGPHKGSLKSLTQDLRLGSGKSAQHLVAKYTQWNDQTTIRINGVLTATRPGIAIVEVHTNDGALSFRY